jgi:hypothetical protein
MVDMCIKIVYGTKLDRGTGDANVYILNELDAISEKVEVMDGKCRKKAKKEDQQT